MYIHIQTFLIEEFSIKFYKRTGCLAVEPEKLSC